VNFSFCKQEVPKRFGERSASAKSHILGILALQATKDITCHIGKRSQQLLFEVVSEFLTSYKYRNTSMEIARVFTTKKSSLSETITTLKKLFTYKQTPTLSLYL